MKDAQAITEFVKEIFSAYSLNYSYFFSKYDENDELVPAPIFEEGIVAEGTLGYLAEILGMDAKDIAETNSAAAFKIFKKYRFFQLLQRFENQKFLVKHTILGGDASIPENKLLYAIFGEQMLTQKYSESDLLSRLEKQLKKYDTIIPGTYHLDGKITQFHYNAETLIDFPDCKVLLTSFFKIYDRFSELFFKALNTDLSQDEINEYNLFVTYFQAKEAIWGGLLYYNVLLKNRQIYLEEGYTKLPFYIKINRCGTDFEPWKCKQFAENRELAQRYQNIYTSTKSNIRELCMNIKNIWCWFKWSDAPFVEDPEIPDLGKYQESTVIYIPKTQKELGNDAQTAALLSKLASPVSKGGLANNPEVAPYDWRDPQTLIKRMNLRREVQ